MARWQRQQAILCLTEFTTKESRQQSADQFRVEAWQLNYLRDNSSL